MEPLPPRTIALAMILFLPMPLLFLFLGIDGIYAGVRFSDSIKASKNWESVAGRILSSHIKRSWESRKKGGFTSFSFEASYEYSVASKKFRGARLLFQLEDYSFLTKSRYSVPFHKDSEGAEKLQKKFPEGSVCTVYFDPAKPGDSILVREATGSFWIPFIGAFSFVIAGILGLVWCLLFMQTGLFPHLIPQFR